MEAHGKIGPYPVGLNYTVQNDKELVAAHYFYTSILQNIPLKGVVHDGNVDFKGEDGSTFHLHFVGNGSNGKDLLTFYNSIGLTGTWTLGNRTLPIDLQYGYGTENPGQRLYAQVTEQPDATFEAMVAIVKQSMLDGNLAGIANHTDFPLRVNGMRHQLTIHNAAELKANWYSIFTPAFLAKLRSDSPHEMFVHEGEAMLGDGELWFNERGLTSINPVLAQSSLRKGK